MNRTDKPTDQVFPFGKNWRRFLAGINEKKTAEAVESLRLLLGREDLRGMTFLDAGSGSGLSSLAAVRLGAERVLSFDADPECLFCARALKEKYFPQADHWVVRQGDVLDRSFLREIGEWDVVYSWGVLHHTGNLWLGLENLTESVKKGGCLAVAVYNDQGWKSRYWLWVKKGYNRHFLLRAGLILVHAPFLLGGPLLKRMIRREPVWERERGMSLWWDYLDWLGGYPFETAEPEEIVRFFQERGFRLKTLKTVGKKLGCNEFLLVKETAALPRDLEKA
jgi:2-polyprenyl-6-hydroxyphenyl methylase/3-demethylubiquinone-9 3-methyltransferase